MILLKVKLESQNCIIYMEELFNSHFRCFRCFHFYLIKSFMENRSAAFPCVCIKEVGRFKGESWRMSQTRIFNYVNITKKINKPD